MTTIPRNNRANGSLNLVLGICVFLVALTWIVFGQTLRHEFVNFDDHDYVLKNPDVTNGLTPHGIGWAFTHSHARNWHPLTTISHMLDCQLYGLKAGGHHFTNLVLHMLAVVLLFLVLREMTGGPSSPSRRLFQAGGRTGNIWRSAFVATLFAIHPLHVESVAWVAERKDVLSGVFFMLTLAAYLRYVRKPSFARYTLVALLFALGLMSKPMLVTLPFALLLLDYWPLERFSAQTWATESPGSLRWLDRQSAPLKLILEKVPLLLLCGASCVATVAAQRQNLVPVATLPFVVRVYEGFVSYVLYIRQMFWPARLAILYPYPPLPLSIWPLVFAIVVLAAITASAIKLRGQRPYFLTGWLWYLGMLVPVIGIIQVGGQARADRYTYLPHIGLYLVGTWAINDLSASWRHRREIVRIGAAIAIIVLTWCAWVQTSYWKNSESLWTHCLAVTRNNAVAHLNLGDVLFKRRQLDGAIFHFQEGLKICSESGVGYYGVAKAHIALGNALLEKGLLDDAFFHCRKALELVPDYSDAVNTLGKVLFQKGYVDEAIACWEKTLSMHANEAEAYASLGDALWRKGLEGDAVAHYEKSLEVDSRSPKSLNKLGWLLSTCSDARFRNGARAVQLAEQADQLAGGKDPAFIRTLAAAYAESGRFNDAIEVAQRALKVAVAKGDSALASKIQMDIDLYRINFPLR